MGERESDDDRPTKTHALPVRDSLVCHLICVQSTGLLSVRSILVSVE